MNFFFDFKFYEYHMSASCYNFCFIFPESLLAISCIFFLIIGLFFFSGFYEYKTNDLFLFFIIASFFFMLLLSLNIPFFRIYLFNSNIFSNMYILVMENLIFILTIFCVFLMKPYLIRYKLNRFEFLIFLFFVLLGFIILIKADNFLTFYLSFELQSLTFFLMIAYRKGNVFCIEAAIKYFILSTIFSGILLLGISFIYFSVGSTNFSSLFHLFSEYYFLSNSWTFGSDFNFFFGSLYLSFFGLGLILISLCFKLTVVPFHFWAPDVYEGSPLIISKFLSVVGKQSILTFVFLFVFDHFRYIFFIYKEFIFIIIILSFLFPLSYAFKQSRLKRFFTYSSMVHLGIIFMGIYTNTVLGLVASICYLFVYLIMNLGMWSFLLGVPILKQNIYLSEINSLVGLNKRNQGLMLYFKILLFCFVGLPPLAGFFGKILIYQSILGLSFFVFIFFLFFLTAISSFYYTRLIKIAYSDKITIKSVLFIEAPSKIVAIIFSIIFCIIVFFSFYFDFIFNFIVYMGIHSFVLSL